MACRSPLAFWVTYHVNNPLGAVLAWVCFHARLTPNMVSWISLVATLSGPLLLCFWHPASRIVEALILVGCLQLGYTLDGADGMLARVAKQGSRFGQLLDKLIDSMVMLLLPPLLYFASQGRQSIEPFGEQGILLITFLAILSRGLLATLLWLKEYVERAADRTVQDTRARNLAYYLRRGIGQTTDTSTFYLALGLAWVTGFFWWLMAVYSIWILVVWSGYMGLTYRDLGRK
jgi:phosphatidylglycerophosphate synthase